MLTWIMQQARRLIGAKAPLQDAPNSSERMLQCLFDQPAVSVAIIDPETGRWLRFNDRTHEALGYTRQEMEGKSWQDFVHPADVAERQAQFAKVYRGEIDSLSGISRYQHKNGSTLYVQSTLACARHPDGRPEFYLATGIDITQKAESDRVLLLRAGLLEKMAEIAQIGAWSLDLRSMRLSWSQEVYRIHGLDPDTPVDVDQGINYYAPEARPAISAAIENAIQNGESWDLELPFINAAGQRLWVRAQGAPVRENGKTILLHGAFQDITTRRMKDEELRALVQQQESLLSNATVGIVKIRQRRFVSCNRRMEEMFGYAPGEMDGQSTEIIFPSRHEFEETGRIAYAKLAHVRSYAAESWRVRKDGSRVRTLFTGTVVDQDQPDDGSVWCFIDVSAAWESQQLSRRLLQAVEQCPSAVLITDTQARIEYVNSALCESSGYRAEELLGHNPRMLKSGNTDPATYREMWQHLGAGLSWRGTLQNRKKSGELYWESLAISPIADEQGIVTHYLGIKEDVTKRWQLMEELEQYRRNLEENSQRFEQLAEQSRTVIWEVNADGLFTFVSNSISRAFGYLPEELEGQLHFYDLHPTEARDQYKLEVFEAFSRGDHFRDFVSPLLAKSGEPMWVLTNAIPLWHADGTLRGYRGSSIDITESRLLLQQLEANQELLRDKSEQLDRYSSHLEEVVRERTAELSAALEAALVADRTKDEFLANVSHEMRTPLNVVIGLADLARRATPDGKVADYLDKIAAAGRNLGGIINDLLDLSKIVAGHLEFEQITFNPRDLATRCHAALQHKAAEKGLHFAIALDPSLPEQLIGDPLRVEQIMLNLLNNAIKFTPAGHVQAQLSCADRRDGRVALGIRVEDTGIGIEPAKRDKLFQPFYQVDASITRQYGGTGLGLHICKRLAEMMDGDISADSRPGGGSVFQVQVWLLEKVPAPQAATDQDTALPERIMRYRDVQVLAVDDHPTNLEIVEELLSAANIRTHRASNGQEALEFLRRHGRQSFDLVLMDIQMPVMDGLTATRNIHLMPEFADLPIIALTAHTMEHEKRAGLAAGVNDHIGKPFETRQFYAVLDRWLPRIKQQGEAEPASRPAGFPTLEGVDTQSGLARFAGNAERYRHWLLAFVDESAHWQAQVSAQLASGQLDQARQSAHAMRGRAGMLGASEVQFAAAALEQALEQGRPDEACWQTLQQALGRLCQSVSTLAAREQP